MEFDQWPIVILDALKVHRELDATATMVRDAACFCPDSEAKCSGRTMKRSASDGEVPVVENESGLCERMEELHARLSATEGLSSLLWATGKQYSRVVPDVPPLAALVRQHDRCILFEVRAASLPDGDHTLAPPLLFCGLIHNKSTRQRWFRAMGSRWMLPPASAFTLLPMARWAELGAICPKSGFPMILADPPWHSHSVWRKQGSYATSDKRELLAALAPAIVRLASPSGTLIACWVTNSRHVQAFVEERLFPRCGARPIGRWYWLKLSTDGGWSNGACPRSPHRKPWEVLIIGYIGEGAPPPSIPRRLAIAAAPTGHSVKPPLDTLLRTAAPHLLRQVSVPTASTATRDPAMYCDLHQTDAGMGCQTGRPGCAASLSLEEERAWQMLPKIELFAREVRPFWHSAGDEVLYHQHEGFFTGPTPIEVR